MKFEFGGERSVPAGDIDNAQHISDPVTEAPKYLESVWDDMRFGETHPWEATDLTLLRMGVAANAYAIDRLAETLRKNGVVKSRHGTDELSPDTHTVALALSHHAHELMRDFVRGKSESQDGYPGVLEENLGELNPAGHLPPLPRVSETPERHYEEDENDPFNPKNWQAPDGPIVTSAFIKSLVDVTEILQADANSVLNRMTNVTQTVIPVPSEQAATREEIERVIEIAKADADEVGMTLYDQRSKAELPEDIRAVAYKQAHFAFVNMAAAYVASVTPAMFGEEYLPQR